MSITSIDISALYITMFNRVPEGAGHKFWFNLAKKQGLNTSQVAQQMLNSAPAQEYFAGKNSNEDFVNHIYSNLFGKTIAQDPKGSKFWIDKLKEGNSKAFVVSEMLKAAMSNTYTKPEELKAQKLFLNKLKAAEIAHKAIENVPNSGSITEKIASFANILKNIKDTSTPTQIAQVIKQEALKGNLTVLNSHQLAQITKSIFPSVDADALQKALDNTTATTDIYEEGGSTPTPPTPPAPTPNPGGGSSGGSNNPKPLTPEEQKQKAKEEAVKQAEENLQKAKEAAEQAKKDADIAKEIKEAVEHAINNHNGIKQYALNHIQNKIDDPSTTDKQREALEKAKDIVSKLGRTLDQKNLDEAKDNVTIADKTKDVADKQKDLAQDQVDHAKAVAKEAPLLDAVKKAYEDKVKAQSEQAIADVLQAKINAAANISKVKSDIETSSLTYQQKIAAKAQLEVWAKELNLKDLDAPNNALKDKANEKKQAADTKAAAAAKAYHDDSAANPDDHTGALPDYTKNKKAIEDTTKDVAQAKSAAATAIVALKKAKEDIAKANLNKDPDNEELKAALQKAQSELKNAQAELEKAKMAEKIANLDTVELKKVGDTNVYKSEDGKYTVDLGNDKVADGKTLAVGRGSYKLYEIDENSTDAGAPKHTDKTVLYSHDKGGSVYKNGVEQFSFLSKDGNAVAALKAGGKGFILKPGVKTDYDTMSKANFNDADGKFEIGGADQKAYQIETEKNPLPHNPDNPQYSVTKIKKFEGRDYNFKDKPILDGDFKITGTKDLKDDLKIPLINGKIYAGRVGDYHINTDSDNNLKSLTDEVTGTYNFDADEKVESITKFGYTYNLKGGHKTLADAIALATGAQNALNKASSTVVNNYTNDVFRLDNDGKATSVQLYNKNELTVRDLTPFKPYTIDNLKISEIKFASGEKFTLTDTPKYSDIKDIQKVPGKYLLEAAGKYINSEYEVSSNHKFTVTRAGEDNYILTETKDGKKVSVEIQYREPTGSTVLKTVKYEDDGTTVKSVDMVDQEGKDNDIVTVTKGETNAVNGRQIGIKDVNAGKVSFKGIEKIYVDSSEALDGKGLDYLNKSGAKEIKPTSNLTLENKDGGTLDLGKIKYDKKLTIKAGNTKSDTVKLGAEAAGNKLSIEGFEQQDKIDFSALGATDKNVTKVASNAGQEASNGKIYTTDVAGDIAAKNYGGDDFDELFGNGKTFKTTITQDGKSIVAVKGNDVTKVYQVNDTNHNGTIDSNEVKLVGTFESNVELGDANIA